MQQKSPKKLTIFEEVVYNRKFCHLAQRMYVVGLRLGEN